MNILIVYDGNVLKKVADAMNSSLKSIKGKSMKITEKDVDRVTDRDIAGADLFLIGSDTVKWNASNKIINFLRYVKSKGIGSRAGAAFGAKLKFSLSGSSSRRIEKLMKMLHFNIVAQRLEVLEDDKGRIDQKELDKAKRYAKYIWMY